MALSNLKLSPPCYKINKKTQDDSFDQIKCVMGKSS